MDEFDCNRMKSVEEASVMFSCSDVVVVMGFWKRFPCSSAIDLQNWRRTINANSFVVFLHCRPTLEKICFFFFFHLHTGCFCRCCFLLFDEDMNRIILRWKDSSTAAGHTYSHKISQYRSIDQLQLNFDLIRSDEQLQVRRHFGLSCAYLTSI